MRNVREESRALNRIAACWKQIVSTVVLVAIMLALQGLPVLTLPASAQYGPGGASVEGFILRFNVGDIFRSTSWYTHFLGMGIENDYGNYVELSYPELSVANTKIALSEGEAIGSNQATATIQVSSIEEAMEGLEGWPTTGICDAGFGVALTFFCDPDNNSLAFRQEGYTGPFDRDTCPSPMCPLY